MPFLFFVGWISRDGRPVPYRFYRRWDRDCRGELCSPAYGTGDPSATDSIVGGIFSRYPLFMLEKSVRLCYTTIL